MNDQQLTQIEQRIERNEILLDHPPSNTFKCDVREHAALLQANDDLRILIHEVKMSRKSFRVEIDEELHAKVKIKAAVTGQTVAGFCREALRRWVEEEKPIILPPQTQPIGKIPTA